MWKYHQDKEGSGTVTALFLCGAETLGCVYFNSSSRHRRIRHSAVDGDPPAPTRRLSSAINHAQTHQLKGQNFVGSWVVYNLLKVRSHWGAKGEITRHHEWWDTGKLELQPPIWKQDAGVQACFQTTPLIRVKRWNFTNNNVVPVNQAGREQLLGDAISCVWWWKKRKNVIQNSHEILKQMLSRAQTTPHIRTHTHRGRVTEDDK